LLLQVAKIIGHLRILRVARIHPTDPLILLEIPLICRLPSLFQIQTLTELRVGKIRPEGIFRGLLLLGTWNLLRRPHRLSGRGLRRIGGLCRDTGRNGYKQKNYEN
jgi:hypothetical protein